MKPFVLVYCLGTLNYLDFELYVNVIYDWVPVDYDKGKCTRPKLINDFFKEPNSKTQNFESIPLGFLQNK